MEKLIFSSVLGMHNGSGEYKTTWNCKKFTDRWTDRGPTSDKLTWTYGSSELKTPDRCSNSNSYNSLFSWKLKDDRYVHVSCDKIILDTCIIDEFSWAFQTGPPFVIISKMIRPNHGWKFMRILLFNKTIFKNFV